MSLEAELIKTLSNRDRYEKYYDEIDKEFMSDECYTILKHFQMYYDSFTGLNDIDLKDFKSYLLSLKKATLSEDKKRQLEILLDKAAGITSLSPTIFDTICKKYYGAKIYDTAFEVIEGMAEVSDIADLVEDYEEDIATVKGTSDEYVHMSASELVTVTSSRKGLPWSMSYLNEAMGELCKGDLIMVGGRPDSGKTTFLADQVRTMIPSLGADEVILWFNNEEQGSKVLYRVMQSIVGQTSKQIEKDIATIGPKVDPLLAKIKLYDSSAISVHDVEKEIRKHKPGLIIIDQLSKLSGIENENGAEKLRMIAERARGWAKKHAPVVFTVWADGSAEGQKYIDMSQLYGSKTGLQGEADAIICLGRQDEEKPSEVNRRYIYIPKNKLPGKDPKLRNLKCEVEIQPEIARFKI